MSISSFFVKNKKLLFDNLFFVSKDLVADVFDFEIGIVQVLVVG